MVIQGMGQEAWVQLIGDHPGHVARLLSVGAWLGCRGGASRGFVWLGVGYLRVMPECGWAGPGC